MTATTDYEAAFKADTQSAAKARVIVKRARAVLYGATDSDIPADTLARWLKGHAAYCADGIANTIRQRAELWAADNNAGAGYGIESPRYNVHAESVDILLGLIGIQADWGVGLYPTFEYAGRTYHDLPAAIEASRGNS